MDILPKEAAGRLVQNNSNRYIEFISEFLRKKGVIFGKIEDFWNTDIYKKYKDDLKEFYEKYKNIKPNGGFYIYVSDNLELNLPLESLFIVNNFEQNVFNILILGKNSKAIFYSACTGDTKGVHKSTDITIIDEGSKLEYVMIHKWEEEYRVFVRSNTIVKKNSTLKYTYINLKGNKLLEFNSTSYIGEKANAEITSLMYSNKGRQKISKIIKISQGARAVANSKVVARDSNVDLLINLIGDKDSNGYSSCDALIIGNGYVRSIPKIEGKKNSYLFHEAAVGKIANEVIEYLMIRGLDKDSAVKLYIQEFLSKDLPKMDPRLEFFIRKNILDIAKGL